MILKLSSLRYQAYSACGPGRGIELIINMRTRSRIMEVLGDCENYAAGSDYHAETAWAE